MKGAGFGPRLFHGYRDKYQMNRPCLILRYVKLTTDKPLDQEDVKAWFQAVKDNAPSGVVSSVQTTDNQGSLRSASLVHRERDGAHDYLVPLTRDLKDKEVEPIIQIFSARASVEDWDVEVSSAEADLFSDKGSLSVEDDKFSDLCTAWAKRQHDEWMKARTESGWRFGSSVSTKNKTHPLLRPWYDLPEQFRKVDFNQPQSLLDLLNDQGYAVISKTELEAMMSLLRSR